MTYKKRIRIHHDDAPALSIMRKSLSRLSKMPFPHAGTFLYASSKRLFRLSEKAFRHGGNIPHVQEIGIYRWLSDTYTKRS